MIYTITIKELESGCEAIWCWKPTSYNQLSKSNNDWMLQRNYKTFISLEGSEKGPHLFF
jgi:hypothetical protein